jgi:hypothetical protein
MGMRSPFWKLATPPTEHHFVEETLCQVFGPLVVTTFAAEIAVDGFPVMGQDSSQDFLASGLICRARIKNLRPVRRLE